MEQNVRKEGSTQKGARCSISERSHQAADDHCVLTNSGTVYIKL